MTRKLHNKPAQEDLCKVIVEYIDSIKEDLWSLNKQVHDNPETAYKEHKTHDNITKFLEDHHQDVTRHAYGIDTAFESRSGSKDRLVNFNAEYDALPDIGHACGHNLICIAGVGAYLGLSHLLKTHPNIQGQLQLLGTPAEESQGGKIKLLEAGAYKGVDVSLMSHPSAEWFYKPIHTLGISGQSTLAVGDITATYTGHAAHAGANPWDGINALDALVASYNNISLLRQQIHPDERIHGAIQHAPTATNVIPAHTQITYSVRSATIPRLEPLLDRVTNSIKAGAEATGCTLTLSRTTPYANVKVNVPLAESFTETMATLGVPLQTTSAEPVYASTDMGNVSNAVPGLHAVVGIPTQGDDTAFPHNKGFERASGTREAFERFVLVAKGLAGTGLRVLMDEAFVGRVRRDFER